MPNKKKHNHIILHKKTLGYFLKTVSVIHLCFKRHPIPHFWQELLFRLKGKEKWIGDTRRFCRFYLLI